jgi:valyl-tRNA synthetase
MPFITDTLALQLWRAMPSSDGAPSLVVAKWPEPRQRDQALEDRFAAVIEVVRTIRNLRQSSGVRPGQKATVALGGDVSAIRELGDAIAHLTQSEITFGGGTGQATVVRAIEVRLAIEHDVAEHRGRLERELVEAQKLLRHSQELLARPGFAEKAPPSVVANEQAKLAEREERVRLLDEELRRAR